MDRSPSLASIRPQPDLRSSVDHHSIGKALTVGEVAARSGVAVSTLHYYEARGLIRSSRSRGNQRRYAREVLRRVSVIKVAQRVGVPLASIREALKTPVSYTH